MIKILKNTTASPITVVDVGGIVIAAFPGTYTIPAQDYLLWAASSDIITYLNDGPTPSIIVNDGSRNLNPSDGMDLIKGNFPDDKVFNPTIFNNTTDAAPNTQTSQALPTNTRRFIIINRSPYNLQVKYLSAAGPYLTVVSNGYYEEDKIGADNITLYYQSAGMSERVEIVSWT